MIRKSKREAAKIEQASEKKTIRDRDSQNFSIIRKYSKRVKNRGFKINCRQNMKNACKATLFRLLQVNVSPKSLL